MKPTTQDTSLENEVERIAKEYNDFAYIVSHDLNAPLRHIKEFTRLLIGGRKDQLTEEEQEYVEFLEKSLSRIDGMQKALLTFSRLNTRSGPLEETDCNDIVVNALHELSDMVDKHAPVIEHGQLPIITAEPKQLHLLFVNLIDNALKFHDGSKERQVTINATDQKDAWLFEIKDNGIGIAEEHHEKVFLMFRRLNPDKYTGIGTGLTIARKITQHHGGDIHIESEPGKGTSLFFSIGKPQ